MIPLLFRSARPVKTSPVRAGILFVARLDVGTCLFSLTAKAASGVVKIVAGILLLAIGGGGFANREVKKFQRHRYEPKAPATL